MKEFHKKSIEWHPKADKIIQIPKEGLEYAFVSEDNRQINQLIWCKDFLQDVVFASLNRTAVSIYNFNYDPAIDPPLCLKKTRVVLVNWKDDEFRQRVLACLDLLHQIESVLKMQRTVVQECIEPPLIYQRSGAFILNSSNRWMIAPPMISFYALLLRVGMVHKVGDTYQQTFDNVRNGVTKPYFYERDQDYLRDAQKGIGLILRHTDKKLFHSDIRKNYLSNVPVNTMHNYCGIVAYSKDQTKTWFPYWHRLEEPCKSSVLEVTLSL